MGQSVKERLVLYLKHKRIGQVFSVLCARRNTFRAESTGMCLRYRTERKKSRMPSQGKIFTFHSKPVYSNQTIHVKSAKFTCKVGQLNTLKSQTIHVKIANFSA